MISLDERFKYYLGDTNYDKPPKNHTRGYDVPIFITRENYKNNWRNIHPNTAYPIDISRFLGYEDNLWFDCGDSSYTDSHWPVFVKTRDSHNPNARGILASLESPRHWGDVFKHKDPLWESKKDEIIWRGADTGFGVRLDFVKKFKDTYDIGFSQYVQDALKDPELYPQNLLKSKKTIEELLEYKYLPVVDGNDKSSSLGWVLSSNSVPIMPKPKYHSWLCEPWLEPEKHYVEVQRDFSDLPEKLNWCKQNEGKCKEIAEEGKKFMIQFMNPLAEQYLERKLSSFATNHHSD